MASVKLSKFVEAMGFKNLTPDIDLTKTGSPFLILTDRHCS